MDLEKAKCPICMELLCRPVSGDCGHNFCKSCVGELVRKSFYYPQCPTCKGRISEKLEVNKLLESVLEQHWQRQYKARLEAPVFRKSLKISSLYLVSALKTSAVLILLSLPWFLFFLICHHPHILSQLFFRSLRIYFKISTYKTNSVALKATWTFLKLLFSHT